MSSGTRSRDRLNLKGRVGEALVENILRRAGYKVARLGRESQVQHMLRTGISEFLPDFLVWKSVDPGKGSVASLNRVLSVEVKYRHSVPEYLQRFGAAFLAEVAEQWPDLYVVIVTDDPEPSRSCFQALDLRGYDPSAPAATRDLYEVPELDIYRTTVAEYEELVKQIFSLLGSPSLGQVRPRKPLHKIGVHYDGAHRAGAADR
jgi:hypothetical protein